MDLLKMNYSFRDMDLDTYSNLDFYVNFIYLTVYFDEMTMLIPTKRPSCRDILQSSSDWSLNRDHLLDNPKYKSIMKLKNLYTFSYQYLSGGLTEPTRPPIRAFIVPKGSDRGIEFPVIQ